MNLPINDEINTQLTGERYATAKNTIQTLR
jgi:hypothetical protein